MKVNQKVLDGLEHVQRSPLSSRNVIINQLRSCGGQPKSVWGFGACSEVPFVLKECKYINWDTLELDIWIPHHYVDNSNFTLWTKKNTKLMPSLDALRFDSPLTWDDWVQFLRRRQCRPPWTQQHRAGSSVLKFNTDIIRCNVYFQKALQYTCL